MALHFRKKGSSVKRDGRPGGYVLAEYGQCADSIKAISAMRDGWLAMIQRKGNVWVR